MRDDVLRLPVADRPTLARPSLTGLLGNDEPQDQVHHLADAEEPEENEPDAHERRVQPEELGQPTAHASKETA